MSKTAQRMLDQLGASIGESIGVRAGESTNPNLTPIAAAAPSQYLLDRSSGTISPELVIPDPGQPRKEFDETELQQLSDSIKEHGQLQPIKVRWSTSYEKWLIVCGERRWRAVRRAGLPTIRCTFFAGEMSEQHIRAEQLIENLLRSDLKILEKASAYRELMHLNGFNATQLAASLNVDKASVSRTLALLELPADLQAQVARGEISPSAGYELAKCKDPERQRQLALAAGDGRPRAEIRRAAKSGRPGSSTSSSKRPRPTNETFRVGDLRVTIASRRHAGDQAVIDALLEAVQQLRSRSKKVA